MANESKNISLNFVTKNNLSENTLDLIDKSLEPTENTLDLIDKSLEPSENTLDLTENTLDNLTDKFLEPSENTLDLIDKSLEPSENTLDLIDKSLEPSENTLDLTENTLDNLTDKFLEPLNDDITCLCLSGGGIKGLGFIGVLEKLIEHKKIELNKIDMYVGTSVGSIISFFLILGFTIEEIKEFIITFNFSKLNEEIDCIILIEKFGINNGEKAKLLFSKFLELKLNVKDITFKELFNKIQKKILIIGTNLTKCQEELFSVDTTPDMSVITAIRISMSIPIIFTPVIYNNSVYVDGALVNNFPINYCPKDKTFGIYANNFNSFEINSIQSVITACTNVVSNTISQKNLNSKYKNIIKIVYSEQSFSLLDSTQEDKKNMIEIGYKTAADFLNQNI